MKLQKVWLIGLFVLIQLVACDSSLNQEPMKSVLGDSTEILEKKSKKIVVDSLNNDTFTIANTSGSFSEGQGSDKKKSTEKPNRKRVFQDLTHPFQTPVEFVDETTDPAFDYSSPNECEIILADTLQ
ncbi:MAG: hypothetical protein ACK44N_02820 [Bacteroidota bacterium]|jgi:hypothetical protein